MLKPLFALCGAALLFASGASAATVADPTFYGDITVVYDTSQSAFQTFEGTTRYAFSGGGDPTEPNTFGHYEFRYDGDRPIFDFAVDITGNDGPGGYLIANFYLSYEFQVTGAEGLVPLDVYSAGFARLFNLADPNDPIYLSAAMTVYGGDGFGESVSFQTCGDHEPTCYDGNNEPFTCYMTSSSHNFDYDVPHGASWDRTSRLLVQANQIYTIDMSATIQFDLGSGSWNSARVFVDPDLTIALDYAERDNYVLQQSAQVAPQSGGAVPEPATWALMIFGFGAAGSQLRRRHARVRAVA